ncbi:MAG: DNA-formamidopyrimidine glycosylase [Deltaproteobacteria bacterium]|jgi:formamidopyrimidine-DNA glycosylase|nr:DNA-formamidopyrimidine glycosylase [Deltaproteobacteria bacterium]
MPELPEVEVTRRHIAPVLVGRTVREVRTTGASYFFVTPPPRLARALRGATVEALERTGKYLVADIGRGRRLLLHLGMTGQLFSGDATSLRLLSATARASLSPEEQVGFEPDRHTHLQLAFEDAGPDVLFRDVRKFGKVQLLARGERSERLERLGTDALEIQGDDLFRATRRRKVAIKTLLLDQSVVAGSGNIYTDEALFLACVRPGRAAARVTRAECERLADALHRIMARSIETGGSSISDYVAPDGRDGRYQDERKVYARAGEPCLRCDGTIRRKVIGARSSHYCPGCQR